MTRNSISVHSLGVRFWGRFKLDRNQVIAEVRRRYFLEKGGDVEDLAA